ncbi:MAG: oxygenase MpaB family protein [Propionibacteriaceae bacterium]|nr:oxygenase MpaB family protein [Propionibacteriaceae bacterium]
MRRRIRHRLGTLLRSHVAGKQAAARAEEIWGTPGPRQFRATDPIWRVHDHPAMYLGGIAALLLQSLHPRAMAGVAGHSGYRSDPWGRVQRTADYIAATTFGTDEIAEAALERVRAIHRRVRGRDDVGRPYRADDPELLRWVGTAEAYAFLTAHQHCAQTPLSPAEADLYVAQSSTLAERLGATGMPADVTGLHAALSGFGPELVATPAALDAADFLLREPPLPPSARAGYAVLAAGAVSLLPDWARARLGLSRSPARVALERRAARIATAAVGWGLAGLTDEPARLHHRSTN